MLVGGFHSITRDTPGREKKKRGMYTVSHSKRPSSNPIDGSAVVSSLGGGSLNSPQDPGPGAAPFHVVLTNYTVTNQLKP